MVDWDRYRGGLEAVGQLVGLSMQCRVIAMSINFLPLGDFVLCLISSFEFVGMGDNMTRKKKL